MRCSPANVYYIEKMLATPERVPGFHCIPSHIVAYGGNLTSLKGIELLENVGEFRLGFFDDFRRGALERLFGGDAVEPALLRQLFVDGKVEPDEQLYGAAVLLILGFVGF